MRFLTLDRIKEQCIVDKNFHDDDEYLTHLGDVAEQMVEAECDAPLDEIAARYKGQLPKPLEQAMLLLTDYFYGGQRGSDNSNPEMPIAVQHMVGIYRYWGRTR